MTLREYAKAKGITYMSAWRRWNRGQLPGAYKNEDGIIVVVDEVAELLALCTHINELIDELNTRWQKIEEKFDEFPRAE